jgi:cytidine deaminase
MVVPCLFPWRESDDIGTEAQGGTVDIDHSMMEKIIAKAKDASRNAYCPYSKFPVGAAVLTARGRIFTGCNVENASYGLTVCAERNAVFRMIAGGAQEIAAVAVYTPTAAPAAPCGACRQVICEFGPEAWIICVCDTDKVIRKRLSELMPLAFGPEHVSREGEGG